MLDSPAETPTPAARARAKRPALRAARAGVAVIVVLAAGWFVWGAADGAGEAAPATPTPLPVNEGVLGTHLDELMESVTP